MEIKVQCDCGQKYKFDVQPVNGQMPFTVNCPVCGVDGTARANVILQQVLPPAPIPSASVTPPPLPPPPPLPRPVVSAPAPMRPAGLSINRPAAAAPVAAISSAEESADDSKAEDDSSESVGLKVVHLGWKGWAVIGFLIGAAIFGSYLKSAQRNLVRDVLDWGLAKITGGSSSRAETAGAAIDYKVSDQLAEEEIKAANAAEARAWLAESGNAIFEGEKAEVKALMEALYQAGCSKVYMTGIEKLGGTPISASMVAVLPTEPAQRQVAFKSAKDFAEKHGETGDEDKGQKYVAFSFD